MKSEAIHPIRKNRYLRPQEEWKEIIAIYLYLAGMGAGSFIIGTLLQWLGAPMNPPAFPPIDLLGIRLDLAKVPLLWGPVLVSIGAPFLILDLGIKTRFLYACLNPRTSWVARGFIILSVFILLGWLLLAKSVLPLEGLFPQSPYWHIPEGIALVFAFATAIYTGILLKATRSIPLWNTSLLPLLFLVSALSTGAMAITLATLGTGIFTPDASALKTLMHVEQMIVGVEAIVLFLFLRRTRRVSEQGKDSVRLLLFGEMKWIFWGGIVLLGFLFPLLLEAVASFFPGQGSLIFIAGILLLFGGFFLRLGVLQAGIKEQIPMHRLMEIQYNAMMERTKALERLREKRTQAPGLG